MKKGLAISLFLIISLLFIQSVDNFVYAGNGSESGIRFAGHQFPNFGQNASPRAGLWEATGNFDGSFTVSADGTKITDLSGSFATDLCGDIDVPGDLDPPAETSITNDEFTILMNESGTTNFLSISGTFTSDTTMEGDYGWGVDGCGLGGRLPIEATWKGADTTPTTEPPTPEPTPTGQLVMTVVIVVTPPPNPGQWNGSGNFDGTFTVNEDSTKITDLSGSFDTFTCGKINVPGDLDPPAEIPISGNKFSTLMSAAGSTTYLNIDGTFISNTMQLGGYDWGVDSCGAGGPILFATEWGDITQNTEPLFETVLYMPDEKGYATIPDNDSLDLGVGDGEDFTIDAFFYVPDLDYDDNFVDLITRKDESYSFYISFNNGNPDYITFEVWTTLFDTYRLSAELNEIPLGWHHVAAVYDNEFTESQDTLAIYLDGNRVAYSPEGTIQIDLTPGVPNSIRKLEVGGVQGGVGFYGYLEEIRLSSVVRYSGPTYNESTEPFTPDADTRALWHFDETPGSTNFADESIYGNNLTGGDGAQTYKP
jgi:hypothetical protein